MKVNAADGTAQERALMDQLTRALSTLQDRVEHMVSKRGGEGYIQGARVTSKVAVGR
jgi:hypothetical protein